MPGQNQLGSIEELNRQTKQSVNGCKLNWNVSKEFINLSSFLITKSRNFSTNFIVMQNAYEVSILGQVDSTRSRAIQAAAFNSTLTDAIDLFCALWEMFAQHNKTARTTPAVNLASVTWRKIKISLYVTCITELLKLVLIPLLYTSR